MNQSKWAAYDVARQKLLMRFGDVSNALHLEEAKTVPDRAAIAALEAELDALNHQYDMLLPEPHFIETGDADDIALPLPIFVTRQGVDRSHDEAMQKALQADLTYAAELRTVLTTEGAADELAILDRYTSDERLLRLAAVAFARASIGLEGFKPTAADKERCRAFVEGEITLHEFIKRSIEST